MKKNKELTRDDVCESDRGERAYYESKRSLKEQVRLPITEDGVEALLEMVTGALEIPLDDTTRQVFAGYVHHLGQTVKHTTYGEVGSLLYKHMANHVTWKIDQATKEKARLAKEKEKEESEKAKLTLAKDEANESKEADAVQ